MRRSRLGDALRWLLLAVTALVLNFPILATLLTSLKTTADINASPPVLLFAPTLEHFRTVLTDPALDFPRYLVNSTVMALGGTALALALSLPAAYAIVRLGIGARVLLPLVTNLRAVPLVIFAIPIYLMYQLAGLLDTRLGLALIACVVNLPTALILLVGFVQELPVELDEAARVDGAGTLGILRHVVLPLARPMLLAVGILSFIFAWNEFLFGLILTTKDAVPVTVGATFFITSWGVKWGATAAAMTLSALPPMLLGLVAYRWLGKALLAGAVKG
ncbi:MAG: carbohydrate ABC transporter permease [Geminicoccaceae bacterium]